MIYNVISGTGKVSLHHYRKKKGIGGTMGNMAYLSVLILLAVGWAYTYLYMSIQLHGFDEEYDEEYGEEYIIYTYTEERLFFVSSIDYDEMYGNYRINYWYTSDDKVLRLPKYEALALVMALNCYQENGEEVFRLKKM